MFQAELDQLTITDNPADVAEQCSATAVDEDKHFEQNINQRNHEIHKEGEDI